LSVNLAIIDEVSCFPRDRLADKAQDGPTNRFDQLLCSTDGVFRTIVCKEMQPPTTVIDKRQVLDTRHRERTWGSHRRPKDAVREDEAVTLRGLHEEVFLRRSHGLNQCPKRIAKSIQLLRIMLIHADYVTAELRAALPAGSTGVRAHTNIRAFKCPIDLTKNNRR